MDEIIQGVLIYHSSAIQCTKTRCLSHCSKQNAYSQYNLTNVRLIRCVYVWRRVGLHYLSLSRCLWEQSSKLTKRRGECGIGVGCISCVMEDGSLVQHNPHETQGAPPFHDQAHAMKRQQVTGLEQHLTLLHPSSPRRLLSDHLQHLWMRMIEVSLPGLETHRERSPL